MSKPTGLVEERWLRCAPDTADARLDKLRARANWLRLRMAERGDRPNDSQAHEYAALMWAIGELSGIGDELRRERAEREHARGEAIGALRRRALHAETTLEQVKVKNASLKTENHLLRMEIDRLARLLNGGVPHE